MNSRQHYQIGEETLVAAENATDHLLSYRLAATAQAHFLAAMAWQHGDREELVQPSVMPSPVGVGFPIPGRRP